MIFKFLTVVTAALAVALTAAIQVELQAPSIFVTGSSGPSLAQIRLGNEWTKKYNTKKGQKTMLKEGIFLQPIAENMFLWELRITGFDLETAFGRSTDTHGIDEVIIHLEMDDNFPMKSPFGRIVWPQIRGPYITAHGAMCQEVLNMQVTGMLLGIGQTLKAWFQNDSNGIVVGGIGNGVKGGDGNWAADSKTVSGLDRKYTYFLHDLSRIKSVFRKFYFRTLMNIKIQIKLFFNFCHQKKCFSNDLIC